MVTIFISTQLYQKRGKDKTELKRLKFLMECHKGAALRHSLIPGKERTHYVADDLRILFKPPD
jgi:hypothetical protein